MVKDKDQFDFGKGVILNEHSKRKHKVLKEYFTQYLITRCKLPQQEKFRLAIVDGFAGGGVYKCGSFGSPLIFIETLRNALLEININRQIQSLRPIEIQCFLQFNDLNKNNIALLKEEVTYFEAEIKDTIPQLHIEVEYHTQKFDEVYPLIKSNIEARKHRNVLFNLDQQGHSHVELNIIKNIMANWESAEVFFTYMIQALLAYMSPDKEKDRALGKNPAISELIYSLSENSDIPLIKPELLGKAEQIIFNYLKEFAPFFTPFAIHNPKGWSYWFIHFANIYRARQVYNNILHDNSSSFAHYGRSGLKMPYYKDEGSLYSFDLNSREAARKELFHDIPDLISESGDAMSVEDFYKATYNETAAHSDDIHEMMIKNPDLQLITASGGERRKANQIKPDDTLKRKNQKSFIFL